MHVAVVGGGIFGQVIAWRLAARGQRATVIEPVGPGSMGSGSGDRSRIVRALYGEPGFAEAGFIGLELWTRWSAELNERLIEPTGVIYIEGLGSSPAEAAYSAWLDKGIANVRALGGEAEELGPTDARARWPALSAEGIRRVVLEPGGGFGRPALAARSIARAALATGRVEFVPGAAKEVTMRGEAAAGVRVELRGGREVEIEADAVVIAAGFAGAQLVEPLLGGMDLGIRRLPHFTTYWDVPYPAGADLYKTRLPAWADLGVSLYGFPDDGESGFKMAWHEPRRDAGDANAEAGDANAEAPGPEVIEALRAAGAKRFPALAGATYRGHYACAYDSTPDEVFQIGPVPGTSGVYFVGGLSGHGYKHAPSIGESVAALVCGAPQPIDLKPYALRATRTQTRGAGA
jgi:glycine/D-amino acid oxidase-like deaminating enzyme